MTGAAVLLAVLVLLITLWILFPRVRKVVRDALPVEMRRSPVHGRGMFACDHISKGTIIERAPLIPFDRQTDLTDTSFIKRYDIRYKDKYAVMLGYASIYNHSDNNNAIWDFETDDDVIYIKAIRDISPEEEVFVNYGPNYWVGNISSEQKV
jgi:SET domain-containing protein